MSDYEKLGLFYLGRTYDLERREATPELLLYESKDLTTHAVCVGMTGSGKTGLCLSLLEEAAIDGIPVLAIDPKGDLGNLLLTFPELRPEDFAPWVDPDEAARRGLSVDELAQQTAETWRKGLADWGQDPERIQRFREAAELAIYTPGSTAGLPLSVLRSFSAPSEALRGDEEAYRDRIDSAVSGILALLGQTADPLTSREHILMANLLDHAWREGRDLDLAALIHGIQEPPFDRVGLLDIESFFPTQERFALVVRLNNLLAAPGFATWLQGEPLDVGRLLYTAEGRPRVAILSIAHLADNERMSFVTILLNEVLAWVRSQPGTSSLRAILYMDEVFGFFPPTANPPAKRPMLTLLKQARAYGLGVVLATQNPVDLDYKGLSNAGTWFLGRLQTERDKARVLDGLEGASAAAGAQFDRRTMETTLSGLGSRVFLMNNVHDDAPVVFQTRWALSYLRGPLTREQIARLMADARTRPADNAAVEVEKAAEPASPPADSPPPAPPTTTERRVVLPPKVEEGFVSPRGLVQPGETLTYRPALLGTARVHYVDRKADVDDWETITLIRPVDGSLPADVWAEARESGPTTPALERSPQPGARFAPLPPELAQVKNYISWSKALKEHLYTRRPLVLWECPPLKTISKPGEPERDFRLRMSLASRELRDKKVDALRTKYAPRFDALLKKLARARERLDQEQAQTSRSTWDAALSFGDTLLGALVGRRRRGSSSVSKVTRSTRRALDQRRDIGQAAAALNALEQEQADLAGSFQREVARIELAFTPEHLTLQTREVRPRKTDLAVERVLLAWFPWRTTPDGRAEPA